MGLKDIIASATINILTTNFDVRNGSVVPTTETVKLVDGAVKVTAVFLYADLANSTGLAKNHPRETTAKVVRAYLSAVTRVIRNRSGEIRSFDGDRVMAIFLGSDAADRAAKAALEIKWIIDHVVQPKVHSQFQSIKKSGWVMQHGTGIDVSEALIVRGGVRNHSDLVSIGDAPNIAAKLSEYRAYRTYITARLWDQMAFSLCFSGDKAIWSQPRTLKLGDRTIDIRSSNWELAVN